MRTINVETINGIQKENIYQIKELSYLGKMLGCKESKKRKVTYLEIPCAFDIETTNIYTRAEDGSICSEPRPFAYMYHWQFCLDDQVVFGRTWNEFITLLDTLINRMNLSNEHRIVVWVHNLAFEFQFFRHFVNVIDGFYKEDRQPLKVVIDGGIEFRDSYALSNMSLQKFCENEIGVEHYKLSGDTYDYNKVRTASTIMQEFEEAYCYNDVRGLCECIRSRMREDTLARMPMTSTGYVRRDCRKEMNKNKKNRERFILNQLDSDTYTELRKAFRGGDTHANVDHASQLLHDISSYDITSSYPASMMMGLYPSTAFFPVKVSTYLNRDMSDFAFILKVRFCDLTYIGDCGIPYISYAKCSIVDTDRVIDNGRLLYSRYVECILTDIDLKIILKEYSFSDIYFSNIKASRYAPLPDEFKNCLMDYYRKKTLLKDDPDKAYEYLKSKNRLNALYGMMVMRIDQDVTTYNNDTYEYETQQSNLDEALAKYYKSRNSFLSYQHGVWVTANSRMRLREMLWTIGKDVVYCDTDSIKYQGNYTEEFNQKNAEIIKEAESCGAYADDKNGHRHYLGVWDYEGCYQDFKTLGAKKYVLKQDGKIKSTIAGVSKKVGAAYFTKHGIDAFDIGCKITDSGHLTAYYNDDAIHTIKIDGCEMLTASNVALVNNSYTIGVTDEYLDLLEKALAKIDDIDYI